MKIHGTLFVLKLVINAMRPLAKFVLLVCLSIIFGTALWMLVGWFVEVL